MKMHVLSGGRLRMRRRTYYPGAVKGSLIDLPVLCVLLKHPGGNVLFDTGCHPGAATDGDERWGPLARTLTPIFTQQESVVHQLPKAGLSADDIDIVVCSHLHLDHCGCNSFFKRATLICHAREIEHAKADGALAQGYMRADWDYDAPLETIEAERDLFGDGRLTLVPAPGHTPGMVIAHVALDRDGAFVLASDAAPVRACVDEHYAPANSWDVDLTVRAQDEIGRLQQRGATIIYGHEDEQWAGLRTGADFYA